MLCQQASLQPGDVPVSLLQHALCLFVLGCLHWPDRPSAWVHIMRRSNAPREPWQLPAWLGM